MEGKIWIVDYFDVYKDEHLRAYKELRDKGEWPKEFWMKCQEDGVYFTGHGGSWMYGVCAKIADHFVNDYFVRKLYVR